MGVSINNSLARQTFEEGRERLVTIASNPWTVGMFGMFIIKKYPPVKLTRHECVTRV